MVLTEFIGREALAAAARTLVDLMEGRFDGENG